jgi:hypothetical protein
MRGRRADCCSQTNPAGVEWRQHRPRINLLDVLSRGSRLDLALLIDPGSPATVRHLLFGGAGAASGRPFALHRSVVQDCRWSRDFRDHLYWRWSVGFGRLADLDRGFLPVCSAHQMYGPSPVLSVLRWLSFLVGTSIAGIWCWKAGRKRNRDRIAHTLYGIPFEHWAFAYWAFGLVPLALGFIDLIRRI